MGLKSVVFEVLPSACVTNGCLVKHPWQAKPQHKQDHGTNLQVYIVWMQFFFKTSVFWQELKNTPYEHHGRYTQIRQAFAVFGSLYNWWSNCCISAGHMILEHVNCKSKNISCAIFSIHESSKWMDGNHWSWDTAVLVQGYSCNGLVRLLCRRV